MIVGEKTRNHFKAQRHYVEVVELLTYIRSKRAPWGGGATRYSTTLSVLLSHGSSGLRIFLILHTEVATLDTCPRPRNVRFGTILRESNEHNSMNHGL